MIAAFKGCLGRMEFKCEFDITSYNTSAYQQYCYKCRENSENVALSFESKSAYVKPQILINQCVFAHKCDVIRWVWNKRH